MSNPNLEKQWTKWYPQEIFLKDIKNIQRIHWHDNQLKQEDFHDINIQNNNCRNKDDEDKLKQDIIEKKIYEAGFKKGLLESQLENDVLKNKLNSLCLSFENNLSNFEHELHSEVLKIVLKISSYVIDQNINFNQSILINYIKKIIHESSYVLKKPRIIIHPDNKKLIENTFKTLLNNHKWILEYDNSIDLNSCKVKSENGNVDTTIHARWQELYRLIFSEEY